MSGIYNPPSMGGGKDYGTGKKMVQGNVNINKG